MAAVYVDDERIAASMLADWRENHLAASVTFTSQRPMKVDTEVSLRIQQDDVVAVGTGVVRHARGFRVEVVADRLEYQPQR